MPLSPKFGTSPASADAVAAAIGANPGAGLSPYVPGALAETIPAWAATTATAPTTGDLFIWAVELGAGQSVGHVGFVTGTTAGATLNHSWTALLDSAYTVLAASADATSTAIGASAWFSYAMAAAYTTTYTGLHYLGVMISNNSGTQPTLCGSAAGPLIAMSTGTGHPAQMYGGQSSTSQTAAPALGTVVTAPTATIAIPYLYCTA
jgi:hypothetical protein